MPPTADHSQTADRATFASTVVGSHVAHRSRPLRSDDKVLGAGWMVRHFEEQVIIREGQRGVGMFLINRGKVRYFP